MTRPSEGSLSPAASRPSFAASPSWPVRPRRRPWTTSPTGLGDRRIFPADNPWNQDISGLPVDPASDDPHPEHRPGEAAPPRLRHRLQGRPNGIPYVVVPGNQPRVPVRFEYADESDPGPYPIPADAPDRGGPRRARGTATSWSSTATDGKLYELFDAHKDGRGWRAGSGAVFDLDSNAARPAGWTSADAAGLPIFPGLVRYDEVVEQKAIRHALRFTCRRTRRAYVAPARHFASRRTTRTCRRWACASGSRRRSTIDRFPPAARVVLARPEDLRHVPGRQRRRLVPQRGTRPALGRRGPRRR